MASSLLRRALRLASPSAVLLSRHPLTPRLPPTASSSPRRLLRCARPARFTPAARFASSAAGNGGDGKLKRVLESEIECAEEDVEGHDLDESVLPENFPFTIIDNPGDQNIGLKREFGNETIEALVFTETSEGGEVDEDGTDNATNDEEEAANLSNISLVVTVDKGEGSSLEFCCTLNPDEINIDSLSLKSPVISDDQSPYEGPEFTDLDENLQREFYNFLEQRGIKPSMASFLQDYMIKKEEKEYLTWLKNMREFIEK